jgi:hypothetical protein
MPSAVTDSRRRASSSLGSGIGGGIGPASPQKEMFLAVRAVAED